MLTDDQIFEINEFYRGDAWRAVGKHLESLFFQQWTHSADPVEREELWRRMQALRTLQAALSDAPRLKQMDQRNQERRYQ